MSDTIKHDRAAAIQSLLNEELTHEITVRPVTSSLYEVTADDGTRWYAKRWSRKSEKLQQLVELGDAIGMPRSRIFKGDVSIQLMEPAPGRELSHHLFLRLVPGLWWHSRDRLEATLSQLGRYLGRLHTETIEAETHVDVSELHLDKYDAVIDGKLHPQLHDELDTGVVDEFNSRLEQCDESLQPSCLVHGDLMLFHVYTDLTAVSIIDFDRVTTAYPTEDVATFKAALELFCRRLPYARHRQYRTLCQAFDCGYFETGPSEGMSMELAKTLQAVRYGSLLLYYQKRLPEKMTQKPNKYSKKSRLKYTILNGTDVPRLKRSIAYLFDSN